jgi:hypothetical protein
MFCFKINSAWLVIGGGVLESSGSCFDGSIADRRIVLRIASRRKGLAYGRSMRMARKIGTERVSGGRERERLEDDRPPRERSVAVYEEPT